MDVEKKLNYVLLTESVSFVDFQSLKHGGKLLRIDKFNYFFSFIEKQFVEVQHKFSIVEKFCEDLLIFNNF